MARGPSAATQYRAQEFAERFDVHVKTVLRAVTDNPHVSDWDPQPLKLGDVAAAFKMDSKVLIEVMAGREHLIDAEKAASMLNISVRRFHQRRAEKKEPVAVARHGRTVRYALSSVAALSGL
jgi:hypothetical protein